MNLDQTSSLHLPEKDVLEIENLLTQYPASGIWKELIQNADDAGATRLHFGLFGGLGPECGAPLLRGAGLLVLNDGEFRSNHAKRINSVNVGSKRAEETTIGKFGLGMKSVFHLCDAFYYLASENQPASLEPPFSQDMPFASAWNPWHRVGAFPDWFTPENGSFATDSLRSLIKEWPHACERWFALYLPLRNTMTLGSKSGFRGLFPSDHDLPVQKADEATRLLPLLHNLEEIACWRHDGVWRSAPLWRRRAHESIHILGLRSSSWDGSKRTIGGTVQDEKDAVSLRFCGYEASGEMVTGIKDKIDSFDLLKAEDEWPIVKGRYDSGETFEVKEQVPPHGAVVWSHQSSSSHFEIRQAVFLPLAQTYEKPRFLEQGEGVSLLLHGAFFLDSARKEPEREGVKGHWNRQVLERVVLPLVLPALRDFCEQRALSASAITSIVEHLRGSQLWHEHAPSLAAEQGFVFRHLPVQEESDGGRWQLIEHTESLWQLPSGSKSTILFETLPALRRLSRNRLLLSPDLPSLLSPSQRPRLWNDGTWLAGIGEGAFSSSAHLRCLNDWLEQEQQSLSTGNCQALAAVAENVLSKRSSSSLHPNQGEWKRFFSLLPSSLWVRIERSHEALRPLYQKHTGYPILVSSDLVESGGTQLTPSQTRILWEHLSAGEASAVEKQETALALWRATSQEGAFEALGNIALFPIERADRTSAGSTASWSQLRQWRAEGVLFARPVNDQDRLPSRLQQALGDTTLYLLAANLHSGLSQTLLRAEGVSELRRAQATALLGRFPVLAPTPERIPLLRFFLNRDEDIAAEDGAAIRYLLCEQKESAQQGALPSLWTFDKEADPFWADLGRQLLSRQHEEWRIIPPELAAEIASAKDGYLNIQRVSASAVESLLKSLHTNEITQLRFNPVEAKRLVLGVQDHTLWRLLPIHLDDNGNYVSLQQPAFWVQDVPVPTSIKNNLGTNVVWLGRPAEDICKHYESEARNCRAWNHSWTLHYALEASHPDNFYAEILNALASEPPLPSLAAALRQKAWIKTSFGGIAPQNVVFLSPLDEGIAPILRRAAKDVGGVGFPAADVPREARQLERLQELFAPRETAIAALGKAMNHYPTCYLGSAVLWSEETEVGPVVEALGVESADDTPLPPALGLLREVWATFGEKTARQLVDKVAKPLEREVLRAALLRLASRHQKAGSREEKQTVFAVFLAFCREMAAHPSFERAWLQDLLLLNKNDLWKRAQELCYEAEGLDSAHLLHQKIGHEFRNHLSRTETVRSSQKAEQDPEGESSFLRLYGSEDDLGERLRAYFAPWQEHVSSQVVGAFLCLMGNHEQVCALASELLEGRSIEATRRRLFPRSQEYDLDVVQKRTESVGLVARVVAKGSTQLIIRNLCGQEWNFPLESEFNTIFAGTFDWGHTQRMRSCWGMQLREIDLATAPLSEKKLAELLRESARTLIGRVYNGEEFDLDTLWNEFLDSAGFDFGVARSVIERHAFDYLKSLKNADTRQCKNLLTRYNELDYEEEEAKRLEGMSRDNRVRQIVAERENLRRELLEGLRGSLGEETLGAVRAKVEAFEYRSDAVLFELFQNADDAAIESDEMLAEERRARVVTQCEDNVWRFIHWGRPINRFRVAGFDGARGQGRGFRRDLEKMLLLLDSDKDGVAQTTGKFGLGFKSVFLVCDEPRVASDRQFFWVRGGFLPEVWEGEWRNKAAELTAKPQTERWSGTLIEMPLRSSLSADERWASVARFEQHAPILLVFARRVRHLTLELPSGKHEFAWSERPLSYDAEGRGDGEQDKELLAFHGILPRRKDERVGRHVLWLRASEASSKNVDRRGIVLALGSTGFVSLSNTPLFWVTAPTRGEGDSPFAINGEWRLDAGRGQLAHQHDANFEEAHRLGRNLARAFQQLFQSSLDFGRLRQTLSLSEEATPSSFWRSLWKQLSDPVFDREPLLLEVFWRDRQALTTLAHQPVWSSGLYEPMTRGEARSSTDAHASFGAPVALLNLAFETTGALDTPEVWTLVKGFKSLQPYVGRLASRGGLTQRLRELWPSAPISEIQSLDLAALLESELSHRKWTAEIVARWSNVLTRGRLEGMEAQEREQLEVVFKLSRWQNRAGQWGPAGELLATDKEDEGRRAAFAPDENVLHGDYDGVAQRLFRLVRGDIQAPAVKLAQWMRQANTASKREAALRYLLEGELHGEVKKELRTRTVGTWLGDLRGEGSSFGELDEERVDEVRAALNLLPPRETASVLPPPWVSIPSAPALSLTQIAEWFSRDGASAIDDWESRVYSNANALFGALEVEGDHGDEAWLVLLLRASLETMGRTREETHKTFIEACERQGWLQPLLTGAAGVDETIERVRDHSGNQLYGYPYFQWVKEFLPFAFVAPHLENYRMLLQNLTYREGELSIDALLSPALDHCLSGSGITPPSLAPLLGIGVHWLLRELMRRDIVSNHRLRRYCFVPSARVRRRIERCGLRTNLETLSREDQSAEIWKFVAEQLGSAEAATFNNCFDLAISLYPEGSAF